MCLYLGDWKRVEKKPHFSTRINCLLFLALKIYVFHWTSSERNGIDGNFPAGFCPIQFTAITIMENIFLIVTEKLFFFGFWHFENQAAPFGCIWALPVVAKVQFNFSFTTYACLSKLDMQNMLLSVRLLNLEFSLENFKLKINWKIVELIGRIPKLIINAFQSANTYYKICSLSIGNIICAECTQKHFWKRRTVTKWMQQNNKYGKCKKKSRNTDNPRNIISHISLLIE